MSSYFEEDGLLYLKYKISLANQMFDPLFLPITKNLLAIADSKSNFKMFLISLWSLRVVV